MRGEHHGVCGQRGPLRHLVVQAISGNAKARNTVPHDAHCHFNVGPGLNPGIGILTVLCPARYSGKRAGFLAGAGRGLARLPSLVPMGLRRCRCLAQETPRNVEKFWSAAPGVGCLGPVQPNEGPADMTRLSRPLKAANSGWSTTLRKKEVGILVLRRDKEHANSEVLPYQNPRQLSVLNGNRSDSKRQSSARLSW